MEHLIIYGLITLAALAFYFLVWESKTSLLAKSQIKRDILHIELANDLNNTSIAFNEQSNEAVQIDRLKLFHDLKWFKFFSGLHGCPGSQVYFFINNWLSSVSLKSKLKFNLSAEDNFLNKNFTTKEYSLLLRCIRCIVGLNLNKLQLFLQFNQKESAIECLIKKDALTEEILQELKHSLQDNFKNSVQIIDLEYDKIMFKLLLK